jgi:hypothetical protein
MKFKRTYALLLSVCMFAQSTNAASAETLGTARQVYDGTLTSDI